MGRTDLVEGYAIRNLRKNVRESMQSHGEEVILLKMFHAAADQGDVKRCPVCYNDVYRSGDSSKCKSCYATTFEGGVKAMIRAWALFSTISDTEKKTKQGEWQPENRQVQLEGGLKMYQNDYLIRVDKWGQNHVPLDLGNRYVLSGVENESLRTGNQIAQTDEDRVGQKSTASFLTKTHVIYQFPVPMVPIPQAEDTAPPWERHPKWFYGEGPPTEANTLGSEFGDMYLDVLTNRDYRMDPDNG